MEYTHPATKAEGVMVQLCLYIVALGCLLTACECADIGLLCLAAAMVLINWA